MADTFSVEAAAEFMASACEPLTLWTDDNSAAAFAAEIGFNLPSVPAGFGAVAVAAKGLTEALGDLIAARLDEADETVAIAEVLGGVTAVVASIQALPASLTAPEPAGLPPAYLAASGIADEIERRIIDKLLIDQIKSTSQGVRSLLVATGIIAVEEVPVVDGPSIVIERVRLDRLSLLFTDQKQLLSQVYGWGTPSINSDQLYATIRELGTGVLSGGVVRTPPAAFVAAMFPGADPFTVVQTTMLEIPLIGISFPPLSVAAMPAPQTSASEPQAVALLLLGSSDASITIPTEIATLTLSTDAALDAGVGVLLKPSEPPTIISAVTTGPGPAGPGKLTLQLTRNPSEFPFVVARVGGGSELRIKSYTADLTLELSPTDLIGRAGVQGGELVISLSDGDGFLSSVLPAGGLTANFDLTIGWSKNRGVFFTGSAGLETTLKLNLEIGPATVQAIRLRLQASGAGLELQAGLTAAVAIGPVTASIEGIGANALLNFTSGNLGPADLSAGFLPPRGIGIAVNAGPVHGGGFISFEPDLGRYSGALELSIYDISVKAFGLIETKVPGVSFSFVIVISAEFTPIQLGFGFTLNGVGGLVGVNRTINSNELGKLVREGRSENLLFPKNLIANAPTIIRDLGTVFPARKDHYVFGPLAKLGWGTPTLITGQIGIIIEIPGVVVILGEIKILLPKPDVPLVKMNMSVAGTLDFANKTFSLDAALHDSIIEGYPISGQMGLRVKWGDQPNFVASIGGFHPAYQPPKDFPKLQPMTLDLGQHGNASITVSGFFAVTSNTVQVGGDARLHAGGSGISLDASVSVKALFVFAPLHFEATIDASVKISFHGYGPSVHLHGLLEGPSPWHIRGELCVSIVFWDACLGFNETFGGGETAGVPEIDPWDGVPPDVLGLKAALQDAGNWSGVAPVGTAAVVSRAQGSEKLVDPVGGLRVQQKAVPVQTDHPISRFGVAKVKTPIKYELVSATFGTAANPPTLKTLSPVNDFFAPAQYFQMDDGKKLSAPGFEEKQAGYVFGENDANLRAGSHATVQSNYTTYIIAGDGTISEPQIAQTPQAQVAGQNKRSAVALGGVTQLGTRRFIDRLITQPFSIRPPTFILSNNSTLAALIGGQTPTSRTSALRSMDAYRLQNKEQRLLVQVSAFHELAA